MHTQELYEKLAKYETVEELDDRNQRRARNILRELSRNPEGVTISHLKKAGLASPYHVLALKHWLLDRDCLHEEEARGHKKLIGLTEKGEEALVRLDEHLANAETDTVSLNFGSSADHTVRLSLGAEHLSTIERISVLLIPEVLELISKTVGGFLTYSRLSKFNLKLEANLPLLTEDPIMRLMSDMVEYSERAKRIARTTLAHGGKIETYGRVSHEDLSDRFLYRAYFKQRLGPAIERRGEITRKNLIRMLELPASFLIQLREPAVKKWIMSRLEDDPNFFMPHFCWGIMGILKKGFCGEMQATPPSWTMLLANPEREEKTIKLARVLENALAKLEWRKSSEGLPPSTRTLLIHRLREGEKRGQKEPTDMQEAYDALHCGLLGFSSDQEFYECWKTLRKIDRYRNGFPEAYRILQKAHVKFIVEGGRPVVSLAKVFADLAHGRRTLPEVTEGISKGDYGIEPGEKELFDPLPRQEGNNSRG